MNADELLREVIAAPDSDGARLGWADAVEAIDPARAALVRTQLARTTRDDDVALMQRERKLLDQHHARWLRELRPHAIGATFRRGFPEQVSVKIKPDIDDLFAKTPVRHLATRTFTKKLASTLRDSPIWRNIRSATFPECKLDAPALATFLGSPSLDSLRALTVPYNALRADAIDVLLASPRMAAIEWLDLSANKLFDSQLVPLLSASHLGSLRHLGLGGGVLAALDGMVIIANHLALPGLVSLSIRSNRLLGEDLLPLEKANLAGLRRLDVSQNEIGGLGGSVLARGPWRDLEVLKISSDAAPKPGLASLAKGEWRALRSLDYAANGDLSLDDVRAFADAPWPSLRKLVLSRIDSTNIAPLANATFRERLAELHLVFASFDDAGLSTLLARPWPNLRVLRLPELGDAGGSLLSTTDSVPLLHTLTVGMSTMSPKIKKALRTRFGDALVEDPSWFSEWLSDDPSEQLAALGRASGTDH